MVRRFRSEHTSSSLSLLLPGVYACNRHKVIPGVEREKLYWREIDNDVKSCLKQPHILLCGKNDDLIILWKTLSFCFVPVTSYAHKVHHWWNPPWIRDVQSDLAACRKMCCLQGYLRHGQRGKKKKCSAVIPSPMNAMFTTTTFRIAVFSAPLLVGTRC